MMKNRMKPLFTADRHTRHRERGRAALSHRFIRLFLISFPACILLGSMGCDADNAPANQIEESSDLPPEDHEEDAHATDGGGSTETVVADAGVNDHELPDSGEPDNMDAGTFGDSEGILDTCVPTSAPAPIRRLTRTEYNLVVRDLFATSMRPADSFVPDEEMHGFDNNASALWVSQILAEQYQAAAELVAAEVTEDLDALLHCSMFVWSEEQCALAFIESFGLRAYRRPLTDDEYARLVTLFESERLIEDSIASGVAAVIEALLQSPHFLYRVEFGTALEGESGIHQLTSYEIASRLSFLLWNSMPDATLFEAAADDALLERSEIAEQARRLLDDEKSVDAFQNFHHQWMQLERLEHAARDEDMFPNFSQTVKPLLIEETERFFESVAMDGSASFHDLLLSQTTYLNAELSQHYGVEGPSPEEGWQAITMPEDERAGLLTLGGVLTGLSKYNQTSPILRGVFVREAFLCDPPPPPPDEVEITPPEYDPNLSTRERFAAHTEDPSCAACHNMIDPIGFGFENYDPVGRYRETEGNGLVIDASGELLYTIDIDGSFVGAVELAHRLTESEQVKECYVDQWFRFGYGRKAVFEDNCNVDGLREIFSQHDGNIDELLVGLTQTTTFTHKRAEEVDND